MAFIEISPDFKLLLKELRRIAAALEMHLLLAYRYRASVPSPSSKGTLEEEDGAAGAAGAAEVLYSSDEDTLAREAEEARREIEQSDEAGLVK